MDGRHSEMKRWVVCGLVKCSIIVLWRGEEGIEEKTSGEEGRERRAEEGRGGIGERSEVQCSAVWCTVK